MGETRLERRVYPAKLFKGRRPGRLAAASEPAYQHGGFRELPLDVPFFETFPFAINSVERE